MHILSCTTFTVYLCSSLSSPVMTKWDLRDPINTYSPSLSGSASASIFCFSAENVSGRFLLNCSFLKTRLPLVRWQGEGFSSWMLHESGSQRGEQLLSEGFPFFSLLEQRVNTV